jgi:hypothetical protein
MRFSNILAPYCLSLLFIPILFSLQNCANRAGVGGGPKDTIAPIVRSMIPKNQSTNFKGNKIIIQFNEWIQEKNLQKELLITPPLKNYTYKVIRDRLEITLQDTLLEHTTYTFNFRKGITDITESNVALNDTAKQSILKLAFSTGNVIDSLQIAGIVKDIWTNQPVKNALVSLYKAGDTLTVIKDTPFYFTFADEKGYFNLYNLGANKYRLYAFTDPNNDLKYKEPEWIGFLPDELNLTDTTKARELVISVAREDHKEPEILKNRPQDSEYELGFSEGLQRIDLEVFNSSARVAYTQSDDGKTTKIYNLSAVTDSIPVRVTATDSVGNVLKTEIKIAFKPIDTKKAERELKKGKAPKKRIRPEVKLPKGTGFEKEVEFMIDFEKPIASTDFSKIKYRLDGDTLQGNQLLWADSTQYYAWNNTYNQLSVKRNLKFKENFELLIDSIAFVSVQQDSSEAFRQSYKMKIPTAFGSISGKVKTAEKNYILQLIDDKFKLIAEKTNATTFDFQYLGAGNYQIRIILDKNGNGRWDASDLKTHTVAEPIIFRTLPNNGKLKERWDIQGALVEF